MLEEAGEIVAQAMNTLLLVQLADRARTTCATRGLASSFELSRMIDTFLSIRDMERRSYCLAMLRGCAIADAEDRGCAG